LDLTLAEGKAIFKALQEVMVAQQMTAYLQTQHPCTRCGQPRRSEEYHTMQLKTVFGTIPVNNPRLHQRPCQPHPTKTFSLLAALLPEHITPELLFLKTKRAALVSYGVTAQLLHDVLPIDEVLTPCTVREDEHVISHPLTPWKRGSRG